MKKKRLAFLLSEQNRRSLRMTALSAMAFFAFMLFAGTTSAQNLVKGDMPIAKITAQIDDLANSIAQIPSNAQNSSKALYYKDYKKFLEAVRADMQNGDTYAVAVKNNRALAPQNTNKVRNSATAGENQIEPSRSMQKAPRKKG